MRTKDKGAMFILSDREMDHLESVGNEPPVPPDDTEDHRKPQQ